MYLCVEVGVVLGVGLDLGLGMNGSDLIFEGEIGFDWVFVFIIFDWYVCGWVVWLGLVFDEVLLVYDYFIVICYLLVEVLVLVVLMGLLFKDVEG